MSWWNILRIYLHHAIIGTKHQKHKQKQMKLPPWRGLPLLPRTSLLVCLVIFGSVTAYVILHSKVYFIFFLISKNHNNKINKKMNMYRLGTCLFFRFGSSPTLSSLVSAAPSFSLSPGPVDSTTHGDPWSSLSLLLSSAGFGWLWEPL